MALLYVLYIEDETVGPCLELIRKIFEPDSNSKPHVTVRGPLRRKDQKVPFWIDETISEIELIEPGMFISTGSTNEDQNTVFVHCGIEKFAEIHQKPDYITSIPHITLYDGKSDFYAKKILDLLQSFSWHLRVQLPDQSKLTKISLKTHKHKNENQNRDYSLNIRKLFYKIIGKEIDRNFIRGLDLEDRLQLAKRIYTYMEKSIIGEKTIKNKSVEGFRIKLDHSVQALKDLDKIYGTNQLELDLFKDSQRHAGTLNPRKLRTYLGQFLTPPELAVDMTKYVRHLFSPKCSKIYFGDPSIGSGTFFSALKQVFPKECIISAVGIEIDKTIASVAKKLWGKYNLQLIEGDFFKTKLPLKRNLILSNPPYVRHHYISREQKDQLRKYVYEELGLEVSGRSNLYIYFLLLSNRWMKKGAVAAWLIPSEFMDSDYGSVLRKYLTERVSLILVHRFDPQDLQFEGVIVSSAVIVLKNKKPNINQNIQFGFGGTLLKPQNVIDITTEKLRTMNKWPSTPKIIDQNNNYLRLDKLFLIKRGIATGANSFFILKKNEALDIGIPTSFLRPILPSPRYLSEQIIDSDIYGYPIIDRQLCVIDCAVSEIYIKTNYPKMWEYLHTAKSKGILDRYLVSKRNPWYKQEEREIPTFLCTYLGRDQLNGRPFRFIWNRSDAIATNVYLFLYPKGELAALIDRKIIDKKKIFDLLNGISASDLKTSGRIYGGGLYKLEPRDLGSIRADVFKEYLNCNKNFNK